MSTFEVKIFKVAEVLEHDNADSLEIIKLENLGYQLVGKKDTYKVGDLVFYFPLDSVLPDDLKKYLGVEQYISKYIKTIKLRGQFSQGLIIPLQVGLDYKKEIEFAYDEMYTDFKDAFGVTKYEKYQELKFGDARKLLIERYDIENIGNYLNIFNSLLDTDVVVMEKVEGTNWALSIDYEGNVFSSQRSFSHKDTENTYFQAALQLGLVDKIKALKDRFKTIIGDNLFTLRGELVGNAIQGNYYDISGYKIYLFDALLNDNTYFDFEFLEQISKEFAIDLAPVLFKGKLSDYLGDKSIVELSHDKSLINKNKLREGIVIRPLKEMYNTNLLGRVQFKQRDPIYLEKHS